MSPARSAPPPAPDRDTEERILDAAHDVFVRQGTAGARMQEIAREAGVNHAMLHYYFRSKERLAEMVFRRAATEFFPSLLAVLAADEPLDAKVERVVALELDMLARRPYLPGYLIAELTHHPDRAEQLIAMATGGTGAQVRERVLRVLERQITERVQAGAMRPMRAEQFLVNLIALCVFPFAARPMVRAVVGLDDAGFDAFIAERRATLPAFFLAGLRP
jgi:AcrR family transcriptional regulator